MQLLRDDSVTQQAPMEVEHTTALLQTSKPRLRMILSGYSFGSMLATFLPSAEKVVEIFVAPKSESVAFKIQQIASELSRKHKSASRYDSPLPMA